MTFASAIAAIRDDWPRLGPTLEPGAVRELRRALAAAAHGAVAFGEDLTPSELLRLALGDRPDHPAWQSLVETSTRRAGPLLSESPELAMLSLRYVIEMTDESLVVEDQIEDAAEARIWLNPMRPLSEVDDDPSSLLVLPSPAGPMTPSFQFDEHGAVAHVAIEVNGQLDANFDPWGAASWWLSPHASLHAIPADYMRFVDGQGVLDAARATTLLPS